MSDDYYRIEEAFLAAGIDPEFSAVIHEYHTNPYVHALVHKLADYMDALKTDDDHLIRFNENGWIIQHPISERLNGTLFDCPARWEGGDAGLRGVYHLIDNFIAGRCTEPSCTKCIQDDPKTWTHKSQGCGCKTGCKSWECDK